MKKRDRVKKKAIARGNHNIRLYMTRKYTPLERAIRKYTTSCTWVLDYYQYEKRWRAIERSWRKMLEGKH